jgi:hypothetical protein
MNVLRPGDLRNFNLSEEPERRGVAPETRSPQLTKEWIDAYDRMSFSETKRLYQTDPQFHALVDQLHDARNKKGDQQ